MKTIALPILLPILLGASFAVPAQTIQKWVDENGVTHFSDKKPAGNNAEVKEIEIPKNAVSGYDSREVNQRLGDAAHQMEFERMLRERQFAEQKRSREARKEAKRQQAEYEEKLNKKEPKGIRVGPKPGPFDHLLNKKDSQQPEN